MANPSEKAIADKERARSMSWSDLRKLWEDIVADKTDDWHEGKALEHLIIRGFELSKLKVEYPYDVPPGGKPIEQIDGLVYLDAIPFLIECKDKEKVDVEAIAKLRNQLLRRPPTTMGCVFVSGEFTAPALILTDLICPLQITLWPGFDIEAAIDSKDFESVLRKKFENLCMYGLTDHSPNYKRLEATDE